MIDALNGNPVARALGVALVQFVWQGALLTGVTAVLLRLLRRHSANARYVAACLGLLAMLAAPIATTVTTASSVGASAAWAGVAQSVDAAAAAGEAAGVVPARGAADGLAASLSRTWNRGLVDRQLPVIVTVWALGVLLLTLQLAGSWLMVERLRHGGLRPLPQVSDTYLHSLAARLGVTRLLRIAESSRVDVPTVVGWLRPLILVPASALAGLSPFQLQAIIAHEIAHIRRHDYLVNMLQSLVETLLFYHPGVWWVSHRIRLEREHSCDDVAAEVCGDCVAYARALASLEELRAGTPSLALAATGGDLVTRIRRLLGRSQPATPHSTWMVIGLSIATVAMVFAPSATLKAGSSTSVGASPVKALGVEPATTLRAVAAPIDVTPVAVTGPTTASPIADAPTGAPPASPTPMPRAIPQASTDQQDVTQAERQFLVAKLHNDVGALTQLLADECVEINQNGNTRNKAELIELFRAFPISDLSTTIAGVRVTNNVAVVTGSMVEQNGSGTDRMLFTRVWRKDERGAWKLVSSSQFRDPRLSPPPESASAPTPTPFGAPGVQLNTPTPPVGVPSITIGVASAPPPPPPPPPPGAAVRVGGDIKEPKKLVDVKPAYPADAMAQRVQGIVILEIVVDEQGGVSSARILRSQPLLDQAALDAVRQWKFTPTLLNGAAVQVMMTVTVNFTLQ